MLVLQVWEGLCPPLTASPLARRAWWAPRKTRDPPRVPQTGPLLGGRVWALLRETRDYLWVPLTAHPHERIVLSPPRGLRDLPRVPTTGLHLASKASPLPRRLSDNRRAPPTARPLARARLQRRVLRAVDLSTAQGAPSPLSQGMYAASYMSRVGRVPGVMGYSRMSVIGGTALICEWCRGRCSSALTSPTDSGTGVDISIFVFCSPSIPSLSSCIL